MVRSGIVGRCWAREKSGTLSRIAFCFDAGAGPHIEFKFHTLLEIGCPTRRDFRRVGTTDPSLLLPVGTLETIPTPARYRPVSSGPNRRRLAGMPARSGAASSPWRTTVAGT